MHTDFIRQHRRDDVLHVLFLLSSHDSTDLISSCPYRICLCCSKQRMCACTASAPCTYKPREKGKSILELESFSFLKKHLSPLLINIETRVLPALLTHNAAYYNIKMPWRIKAQLRIKTIILWLERTAGRETPFVATLWDLSQNWVSLGASITADF